MDDLDRLERLNRLRADGTLTEEEFQQQKTMVLGDRPSEGARRIWLIGGAAAVALALALAWFATRSVAEGGEQPREAVAESAGPAVEATKTVADAPEADRLAAAISPDAIGNNSAYMQQQLGVPKIDNGYEMVFDVDGCTIRYGVANGSVDDITVDVTPTCNARVMEMTLSPGSTFALVLSKHEYGGFVASCLSMCGNAVDPNIMLSYPGSHATNFIGIHFVANYEDVDKALEVWAEANAMEFGSDDVDAFNCVGMPPAHVETMLKTARIGKVVIMNEAERSAC